MNIGKSTEIYQKSGDSSTQNQVVNINNYNGSQGMSKDEVKQLIHQEELSIIGEKIGVVSQEIHERLDKLRDEVIRQSGRLDAQFRIFESPAFLTLLRESISATMCSVEKPDYSCIAMLLGQYQKDSQPRFVNYEIALKIAGRISRDALVALTVITFITRYRPTDGKVQSLISWLEKNLAVILSSELPVGDDWEDELDMLQAGRYSSISSIKNLKIFLWTRMKAYLLEG